MGEPDSFLREVADYHSDKLAEFGDTAEGVGWNGEVAQVLRFDQLVKIIRRTTAFSVNDWGCGFGAFFEYLAPRYQDYTYVGFDVSSDMIQAARARFADRRNAQFLVADRPHQPADYGIASGVFNLRFGCSDAEWEAYLSASLDILDSTSVRGFSFNCLTIYSDREKMRDDLYYADPCKIFDICKKKYSKNVALLHDYEIFDFTILVRKDP